MLDLNALLAPLDGESPSGADLVYDPEFLAMEQAAIGKTETQWSAEVPPDWAAAHEQALAVAQSQFGPATDMSPPNSTPTPKETR
mgnify:CR=1 FL=1